MRQGIITKELSKNECPWIDYIIGKGTKVTEYIGCTYGCVSYTGTACNIDGVEGFVEIPNNAIQWEDNK